MKIPKLIPQEKLYKFKKVIVFPFCMAPCLNYSYKGFYTCNNCDDCQIGKLKPEIEKAGFSLWICGGHTMAQTIREFFNKKHRLIALGVLCDSETIEKKSQLKDINWKEVFIKKDRYLIPKICTDLPDGDKTVDSNRPKIDKEELVKKLVKIGK